MMKLRDRGRTAALVPLLVPASWGYCLYDFAHERDQNTKPEVIDTTTIRAA
jgi:hypothetical protein